MALPIDTLIRPMTRQEVEASIYRVLGLTGTDITTWKSGAVVRCLVVAFSVLFAAGTTLVAAIARSGFLELASGDWLHLVGHYVFGVDFLEATYGTGQLTLINAGGGVYDWDPGDLIVKTKADAQHPHKSYRNASAVHLGAGETVTITITAIEVGTGSNASPGEITEFETPYVGVTCTNTTSVTALDDESDPAYKTRCYERQSSLSPNGPSEAYAFVCKNARRYNAVTGAFDGELIGVNRVWTSRNSTTNAVSVVAALPSGAVSGDVTDITTDAGALNQQIQTTCVPDGVTATLSLGTNLAVPVSYEVWCKTGSGISSDELKTLIRTNLSDFFATQPISGVVVPPASGKVYTESIKAAIFAAHADIVKIRLVLPVETAPIENSGVGVATGQIPILGTVTPIEPVHFVSGR